MPLLPAAQNSSGAGGSIWLNTALVCGAILAGLLAWISVVAAGEHHQAAGGPALKDWRQVTPPGKRPAVFTIKPDAHIEVTAESGVSFLYAELGPVRSELQLSWRWRVEQAPAPTDLAIRGMDDRPLAVHLWFPKSKGDASFWDGLKSALGYPTFGHAITYVWGGTAARGQIIANPHLGDSALIVLRDGETPLGTWFGEEVDPAVDFARAFGHPPASAPRYFAISADTDDKGGTAIGLIDALQFEW